MLIRSGIVLRRFQPIVGHIARYCKKKPPDKPPEKDKTTKPAEKDKKETKPAADKGKAVANKPPEKDKKATKPPVKEEDKVETVLGSITRKTKGDCLEPKQEKEVIKQMRKVFVFRYDPEHGDKSYVQTYELDVTGLPMVLDVLITIKNNIDSTLTFRRSCREGMCGSCSMNIDGLNQLACISPVSKGNKPIYIYPLPHLYVIRDLVPDLTNFYEQYKSIEPWLQRKNISEEQKVGKEFLQSIYDFNKIDIFATCILCACCSTSCPAYWWHGNDIFLGPAILLQAYRWILDSRDNMTDQRICKLTKIAHITSCKTIMNCSTVCPKHLQTGLAVAQMKRVLAGWELKEKPEFNPAKPHKRPAMK